MSDDTNKPKIDLKARLGKKTVGASGPSIPPPLATGAAIPAPPFAAKPPPEPEKPRVIEPQAIKIEMSEEVVEAQKKGRAKVIMIAVGTALVGAVLGYAVGGGMARRTSQNLALQGAEVLGGEVAKANEEIEKMADVLGRAKRTLSDGKYPESELNELGSVVIPFDATYLVGKGTTLMSADINRMLIDFAGKSSEANDQKDRLKRVMGGRRADLQALFDQKEKPKFNWSVMLVNGPHGPMAAMQPLSSPFLVTSKETMKKDGKDVPYAWPEELEVPDGDKKAKLKLYAKGEAVQSPPLMLPVDPGTQGSVCATDTLEVLRKEIVALEVLLRGDKSDPTNEVSGLVDTGAALVDQLKGIGH
jgi:hypothetical protein